MIAERSLQDVVQIVEEIPHAEMPSLLRSADVVVSVSLSDGFSVAVLEAMACGVPLVLSRLPHIDELIVDGTNALTVPATDPVMLADAIVRVLNDEALRASIISANLDLVRTHASFQTELEKVESLYERIAS
jgi:glycosyltransferase involved in cell wall biosynthesis